MSQVEPGNNLAMGLAVGRSRSGRVVALAVVAATSACAAIAGVSGKEVDPCFDGCGDASADTTIPTDTSVPPADGGTDAGPCDCPTGTRLINGTCVVDQPAPNLSCDKPLVLPDCALRLALRLCDTDPPFPYASACGASARPSAFYNVGRSPTGSGKWRMTITNAYSVARPVAACDRGDAPCAARDAGATGIGTFTNPGLVDFDRVVVGKEDGPGCSDITVELSPTIPDGG